MGDILYLWFVKVGLIVGGRVGPDDIDGGGEGYMVGEVIGILDGLSELKFDG